MQNFKGKERSLLSKEKALRDHQKLVGKYLSIPAMKKCSGESFVIVFPVATKIVQVWVEMALE